jgi:hypothetical protein
MKISLEKKGIGSWFFPVKDYKKILTIQLSVFLLTSNSQSAKTKKILTPQGFALIIQIIYSTFAPNKFKNN